MPRINKAKAQKKAAHGIAPPKQAIPCRPKLPKPSPKPKAPQRRDVYGREI
jgi:hypothetical protein